MSIIQRIRDKAAWLIFGAIALAMIGFIVTDAFKGRGGGWFGNSSTTIAKIDGEKIDYTVYQTRLQEAEQRFRASNDQDREMMQNQVWGQLVEETLLNKVFDDLGLFITDKEVGDMLYGPNPPQFIREQLSNPQTGQYDPNLVAQRMEQIKRENPQQFQVAMNGIMYMRQRQKYLSLLENTVYVPKWLVERSNADASLMTNASYVVVPYSTVSDSTVTVTDNDVQGYINKHKEQFKQEESRGIAYVSFSAAPSKEDSASVREMLLNVKPEFDTTHDPIGFLARNGSETDYSDVFVTGYKLQVPFKDSITILPEGAVFGPYLDDKTYAMAKMVAKRTMSDSVKVRHVLIMTRNGTPDSIAKVRIDSVKRVLDAGADWKAVAAAVSDDGGSKDKGGEYEFASIHYTELEPAFSEFIFFGKQGEKKIVKTDAGYHYIDIMEARKVGPAYKVAYLNKPILASTTTTNTASGMASQFSGQSRNAKAFDDNIAKNPSLQKIPVDNITPAGSEIPGLGFNRAFVKWIYESKIGDVSEPFVVEDKYVLAVVTEINEEGTMSAKKARPMVEVLLRNQKKGEQLAQKIGKPASLEAVTASTGQPVNRADSLRFGMPNIPNGAQEPKVIGAAFNKALAGKLSEPITGNMGVYVIKADVASAVPNPGADVERQRQFMQMNLRRQVSQRALFSLRRGADIKDYRGNF